MARQRLLFPNFRLRKTKSGVYYIDWTENGRPRARSTCTRDYEEAVRTLNAVATGHRLGASPPKTAITIPRKVAIKIHRRARERAASLGRQFTISALDVIEMVKATNGRCSLTGVPFDLTSPGPKQRRPWAPSIDRIRSNEGYTKENCRIVCLAANFAMNAWGESVFIHMLDSYIDWRQMRIAKLATAPQRGRPAILADRT